MNKLLLISLTIFISCQNNIYINTDKNTYYDDISDITYLNGYFYSTNYDLSGHAGSQIDLIKFGINSESIYLDNSYDLEMNGQGYFAITNDETDLYLQSRNTNLILKCSAIGERAYIKFDPFVFKDSITSYDTITKMQWQPCGLAYKHESDSLLTIHRNLDIINQYRIKIISTNLEIDSTSFEKIIHFEFVDTTNYGIYAMEYNNSLIYLLGVDTTQNDILITLNNNYDITSIDTIPDSTVVGISIKDQDLYLSYRNKKIERW